MRLASVAFWALGAAAGVAALESDGGPAHRYAAPLHVECIDRNDETGQPIETSPHSPHWVPFPTCEETGKPLEFHYGVEGPQNCTLSVTPSLFRSLSHYVTSEAQLSCRLPSRPRYQSDILNDAVREQEYIPLVFALTGTQGDDGELVLGSKLNVLLHTTPRPRIRHRDTGVLDSGIAYSAGAADKTPVMVGKPLTLRFSVRWFPTPDLPSTDGTVRWVGMGGHVHYSTLAYVLASFVAGLVVAGAWFYGKVLPRRLRGRGLGVTALGVGGGVGNGWGYANSKRID